MYQNTLPVHIRDLILLEVKHSSVFQEFIWGNFVVHKTKHGFSGMVIDQVHKQKILKLFNGKGQKSARDTWNSFPQVTKAFDTLSKVPSHVDQESFALLQWYAVLLYERTSSDETVNVAQKELFTKKADKLKPYPQQRLHSLSTQREQLIKQDTAGVKRF